MSAVSKISFASAHCEPIAKVDGGVTLTPIGSGDTFILLGGSAHHPVLTGRLHVLIISQQLECGPPAWIIT